MSYDIYSFFCKYSLHSPISRFNALQHCESVKKWKIDCGILRNLELTFLC